MSCVELCPLGYNESMPHFDLIEFIKAVGYLGLFGIMFAETGLLVGFFLPGDSLLFTAGILAAQGYLEIALVLTVLAGGAIIGDNTGYLIGKKFGPKIFSKDESMLFNKKHLERAQSFFDKHGSKTIIIARFVPIVRTFTPTLAGVGKMPYAKFLTLSIFGGLFWTISITMLGYYLGLKVDNIEKYIIPGIAIIILLSISPYLKKFLTDKELRQNTYHFVSSTLRKVYKKK
jgi:membrane-associated protein